MQTENNIYRSTKIIAAFVVPFLLLAFLILYFLPGRTSQFFAWEINPSLTSAFMGAGYLGGSWIFLHVIFGREWRRVEAAFLPVTAFTVAMLAATFLHWDRFDPGRLPFQLWFGLYLITPIVVPLAWWNNRRAAPRRAEPDDIQVPAAARWGLGLLGLLLLVFAGLAFVNPAWLISIWPWLLTPLTARVMAGWFSLLGVGGLVIAGHSAWEAWKTGLESIAIWHILFLAAAFTRPADFHSASSLNWYTLSIMVVLVGMAALYAGMETRRRSVGPRLTEE
jgi:hypothetical protein